MADLSDIPDEAVDALADIDALITKYENTLRVIYNARSAGDHTFAGVLSGFATEVAAALPVLDTAQPRLVSGDVPITERTPHGVWIADGPDPDRFSPACGGLSDCDDCRAYDDLRQHLVEQIIALDEQRQRETTEGFPGFYITNDDGYPALTYYPREDEDGEHVKSADAGTSLAELIGAARKHAASLRGEQP